MSTPPPFPPSSTPPRPSSSSSSRPHAAAMTSRAFSHGAFSTPQSPPVGTSSPQLIPDETGADEAAADMPVTVAASVVLTALPPSSVEALGSQFKVDERKINIRFLAVGSTPSLKRNLFQLTASKRFATVVLFLRKRLNLKSTDSLFVYVNSTFAPALDEEVGNLWKCFKVKDELVVNYCLTPAFG